MIAFRSDVNTALVSAIRLVKPNCTIGDQRQNIPAQMPFVAIINDDNSFDMTALDTSLSEKRSVITYEIDIYSNINNLDDRTTEVETLETTIDTAMLEMGFYRISDKPISLRNATIGGRTLRYGCRIDSNKKTYRR